MTHTEAFDLLEELLNKHLPVGAGNNNVAIRRVLRGAALVCAWPDTCTTEEARERVELVLERADV